MMDEIFDRQYQAGRSELNAGLDRAFGSISRKSARVLPLSIASSGAHPGSARPPLPTKYAA